MSNLLASDDANPEFVGARNPDDALVVQFYQKPVQNNFLTAQEGRPIFEDRIFIRIQPPGRQDLRIEVEADDTHKARFPRQWMHYQNAHGGDGQEVGTPLSQWPLLTPAMVEMLKAMKFRTVESIAMAGDEALSRMGMSAGMAPMQLRERAKVFLDVARDTSIAQKQNDEIAELKKQLAELKSVLTTTPAVAPVKMQVVDDELQGLRAKYAEKFGKKPHHKMSANTIRQALEQQAA